MLKKHLQGTKVCRVFNSLIAKPYGFINWSKVVCWWYIVIFIKVAIFLAGYEHKSPCWMVNWFKHLFVVLKSRLDKLSNHIYYTPQNVTGRYKLHKKWKHLSCNFNLSLMRITLLNLGSIHGVLCVILYSPIHIIHKRRLMHRPE